MWPEELNRAASHPFRETVAGPGDVSMLFLQAHFIVERWREALLWSWTVGKHGSIGDEWDDETAARAWQELGGEPGEKVLDTRAGYRETLEDHRYKAYLQASGHPRHDLTQYRYCKCTWLSLIVRHLTCFFQHHGTVIHTLTLMSTTTTSGSLSRPTFRRISYQHAPSPMRSASWTEGPL